MPPWNSSTKGSGLDLVSGDPAREKNLLFGVGGLASPFLFQVPVKRIRPCAVSCCRCHGIRDSLKAKRRMLEIRIRDISRRGRSCSGEIWSFICIGVGFLDVVIESDSANVV